MIRKNLKIGGGKEPSRKKGVSTHILDLIYGRRWRENLDSP
jgi:hypothetical protein